MENIDNIDEKYLANNLQRLECLHADFKCLLSLFTYIKEDISQKYDEDAGNVFHLGYDFLENLINRMSGLIKEIYSN